MVITIAKRTNLVVFVIDGGRTLKAIFRTYRFHAHFLCLIGRHFHKHEFRT